jgi:hypothetical protein
VAEEHERRLEGLASPARTIMDSVEPAPVIAMPEDFQRVMAERCEQKIEELTGRKVLAFLSRAHERVAHPRWHLLGPYTDEWGLTLGGSG